MRAAGKSSPGPEHVCSLSSLTLQRKQPGSSRKATRRASMRPSWLIACAAHAALRRGVQRRGRSCRALPRQARVCRHWELGLGLSRVGQSRRERGVHPHPVPVDPLVVSLLFKVLGVLAELEANSSAGENHMVEDSGRGTRRGYFVDTVGFRQ